jgi:hypothetical protein
MPSGTHHFFQLVGKFVILQSPVRADQPFGGSLRNKTIQDKTGPEALDKIDEQARVGTGIEKMHIGRVVPDLFFQPGSSYQLQLMQFKSG